MTRSQRVRDILKAIKEHQEQIKINRLMNNIMFVMEDENYLSSINLKYVGEKPIDEIFFTFINEAKLLNENNFDRILELFLDYLQQDNLVVIAKADEEAPV